MGVVYYANYLRYFELARLEYFLARGGDYRVIEGGGYGLPVIEAHAKYAAPGRFQDMLDIEVWVSELRRVTLRFDYLISREGDGTTLCTGYTVHACVGKNGRPTTLPAELSALVGDAVL